MSTHSPAEPQTGKRRKTKLNRKEALHLSQAILLEETGVPMIVRLVILTICLIVVAFAAWAWQTRIDEMAIAQGQVMPAGHLKKVESRHGGVVAQIKVREGDQVSAGQVLVILDPTMSRITLEQNQIQEAALLVRKARLEALIDGAQPDFTGVGERFADLKAQQARLYRQSCESMTINRDILTNQIKRYRAELKNLKNSEKLIEEQFRLVQEELKSYQALFSKELVSKSSFFSVKRLFLQVQDSLLQIPITRSQLIERLAESENRLVKLEKEAKEKWMTQLVKTQEELAQIREVLRRDQAQVFEREIRATENGLVHNFQLSTIGEVVEPGETILEIVPKGADLVIEARLSARDIGHLRVGQPVTIKFTAYDYARYGGVTGKLMEISPSAFTGPNGSTYYKGLTSIDRDYVGTTAGQNHIKPGMTVQVEIKTGNKTLIEYLMKPIYLSLIRSFRER